MPDGVPLNETGLDTNDAGDIECPNNKCNGEQENPEAQFVGGDDRRFLFQVTDVTQSSHGDAESQRRIKGFALCLCDSAAKVRKVS